MKTSGMLGPLSQLLLLLMMSDTTDGAITCRAVTSIYETTVTCNFGENIFETKHNFNLQFYHPDLHADPATPLMCNWVTKERIECKNGPNIQFNNVISDQVTIKGPPALNKVGGKYVCQVLPSLNVPIKPCNLTFTDVTRTTATTTTSTTNSKDMSEMAEDIKTSITLGAVALTVSLIVLILIIVLIFIFVCRPRIEKWRKTRQGSPEKEQVTLGSAEPTAVTEPLLHGKANQDQGMETKMQTKAPGPSVEGQPDEVDTEDNPPSRWKIFERRKWFKEREKSAAPTSETMDFEKGSTGAWFVVTPALSTAGSNLRGEKEGKDGKGDKRKSKDMKQGATAEGGNTDWTKRDDGAPRHQAVGNRASGGAIRAPAEEAIDSSTDHEKKDKDKKNKEKKKDKDKKGKK